MSLFKQFLIYSLCAAALTVSVYAADIKCVECADAKTCNDPLNITVVTTFCALLDKQSCGMYSYKNKDERTTVRGCFYNDVTCDLLKTTNLAKIADNSTWTCYMCTGDFCNKKSSGNSFGVPMVALILGAIISLYLYMK